jgi:hypothetical protein
MPSSRTMATVTVTRRLDAPPGAVARHLDAERLLSLEGTFAVESGTDEDDGWLVDARAPGIRASFAVRTFDDGDADGYVYEQVGDRGPFDSMRTRLALEPNEDGTTVTAESTVDLGLPVRVVTDRIAAWKRRGELRRLLDRLADDVA